MSRGYTGTPLQSLKAGKEGKFDVKLIREMNMNAVRCSHYPPDEGFLDLCDSIGLYVLDELAGIYWHERTSGYFFRNTGNRKPL
jgi:beta-galactosidase/beta-glucuronidase